MDKRQPVTLRLPPDLIKQVQSVMDRLPVKPTFTACVEAALNDWIDRQKKGTRK